MHRGMQNISLLHDSKEMPLEGADFCSTLSIINDLPVASVFCNALKALPPGSNEYDAVIGEELISEKHLTRLNLANQKLQSQSIVNLSIFQSLTSLNLSFNRLIDLKSLTDLTALVFLDISHNKINSIEPLRAMEKLETLRCHSNEIESAEPLSRLCNMTSLWLSDNSIPWTDMIFLSSMSKLSVLLKQGNTCNDKPKIDDVS